MTTTYETPGEYASAVVAENPHIVDYLIDGQDGDEALSEAIKEARGAVLGGNDA